MKKVKIPLDDLLVVLEALREGGTKDIIFFSYNDLPAIADFDEPENAITFSSVSEDGKVNEDDEVIH